MQIKKQMCFWFLNYKRKTIEEIDGTEQFTIFDKISFAEREHYYNTIKLGSEELAVFILKVNEQEQVINTTNRFIRLKDGTLENICYPDFAGHNGFKIGVGFKSENGTIISPKREGDVLPFGLATANGDSIYWNIPTGVSGYAFWNITKKCELIGRVHMAC